MRTGRKFAFGYQYLPYHSSPSLHTAMGEKTETYEHFVLPLTAGYRLRLGRKAAVVPAVGMELSYNNKVVAINRDNNKLYGNPGNGVDFYKGAEFEKYFHRVSMWGTGAVNLELAIDEHTCFVVGPAIHYMLTNILNKTPYTTIPYTPAVYPEEIKNYALLLNVGIRLFLGRKHEAGGEKEATLKTTGL